MTTIDYLAGRKKYTRPQAMMWSNNPGTIETDEETGESYLVPVGFEVGAETIESADPALVDQFLILSDHNRSSLDFSFSRIENRKRTLNGRMRSYHIADKLTISSSWESLPSRSHSTYANFDTDDGSIQIGDGIEYTADNGAGGMEILDWYENHPGSFWLFLSYDKYKNLGVRENAFDKMYKYSEAVEVFFSDFSYSVEKRGQTTYDFWNISFTLEEV